jgi:hypothetical protein
MDTEPTKECLWGIKPRPQRFKELYMPYCLAITGKRCFLFLANIVVDANPLAEHDRKLRDVSGRLREHNLKLQPDKCEFFSKGVTFLGHKISEHRIEPDVDEVDSIKNFPTPRTAKQPKSFLGLGGYFQTFVPQLGKTTALLHERLKDVKHIWEGDTEMVFHTLKQKLKTQPMLQYPDFSKEVILTTDAWNGSARGSFVTKITNVKDWVRHLKWCIQLEQCDYETVQKLELRISMLLHYLERWV